MYGYPYGYNVGYGRAPMGEYFLTGASGFGAVPADAFTDLAVAMLADIAAGGTGSATLIASDAQTRQTVCQRALDILALPPCQTGQEPPGSCFNPAAFGMSAADMKTKVIASCQAQGVSVGGLSTTTKVLLGLGAIALVGIVIAKAR